MSPKSHERTLKNLFYAPFSFSFRTNNVVGEVLSKSVFLPAWILMWELTLEDLSCFCDSQVWKDFN